MTSITLYGAEGSGSIAVEAALTLLGIPYQLIEGATWVEESARDRVATQNPMRQVPTLVLPGGEVVTESAAILIYLAETYPEARLVPVASTQLRRQFLRWMVYVSSAIYALHWIKPDVRRIGVPVELRDAVVNAGCTIESLSVGATWTHSCTRGAISSEINLPSLICT